MKQNTLAPIIRFTASFLLFLPNKGNFNAPVFSFPLKAGLFLPEFQPTPVIFSCLLDLKLIKKQSLQMPLEDHQT